MRFVVSWFKRNEHRRLLNTEKLRFMKEFNNVSTIFILNKIITEIILLGNTFRPILVIFRHSIIKKTDSIQFHSMCYINN